ncbi:hypothetical protein KFL_008760020 [Klebsormidium nitens]|uniref:RING-CH-type domain-containing protein n=1 Tax=Klebsormidium nitens TaxID=105231 RepID=A0A1Y1ISW3_KLENI|nr:hypothetical protein KFL_008760020 [Klebsormidium nitens]|eukprot:GAQ91886.1 hypothetical protein KFL_008760020 [Klebsormidium nitens]
MPPAGSEIDVDGDRMMLLAKASQRGTAGAESPLVMSRDLEAGASEDMQCRICLESENCHDFIAPCRCKGTQKYVHRECLDQWRAMKEGFAFAHCTECKSPYKLRVHIPEDRRWRVIKFRFFVTRDILLICTVVQLGIIALAYMIYGLDLLGGSSLQKAFWSDKPAAPFYYCCGAGLFFSLLGLFGCCYSLCGSERGHLPDCRNGCPCDCHVLPNVCLWTDCQGLAECGSCAGLGAEGAPLLLVLAVVVVMLFAVAGVFYSFFVATVVVQRVWQKHYHVLAKRLLAKEYVVEDLDEGHAAGETLPPLTAEHVQQLKQLGLL